MTWEYHVEHDADINQCYAATTLKDLGEQNWEMVACHQRMVFAGVPRYTIVFKRQKLTVREQVLQAQGRL